MRVTLPKAVIKELDPTTIAGLIQAARNAMERINVGEEPAYTPETKDWFAAKRFIEAIEIISLGARHG